MCSSLVGGDMGVNTGTGTVAVKVESEGWCRWGGGGVIGFGRCECVIK